LDPRASRNNGDAPDERVLAAYLGEEAEGA
jgi:hypothetical protein